jgi:hypothetical protein
MKLETDKVIFQKGHNLLSDICNYSVTFVFKLLLYCHLFHYFAKIRHYVSILFWFVAHNWTRIKLVLKYDLWYHTDVQKSNL